MNYPDIQHHGAKDGVIGSCHQLLMDAEHCLLIEGGLFQVAETSAEGKSVAEHLAIAFSLDTIKALVASYVQIDHVGFMPHLLVSRGRYSAVNPPPSCCPSCWSMPSSVASVASRRSPCGITKRCSAWSTETTRPAIVIAGNGICRSGRIVNYLKSMLARPAAQRSARWLGSRRHPRPYCPRDGYADLDGQRYDIRARIHTIDGHSAHAAQKELVNFVMRRREGRLRCGSCMASRGLRNNHLLRNVSAT